VLRTPTVRVVLEQPSPRRRDDFLAAVGVSKRLHGRWVAPPATADAYERWLRRFDTVRNRGHFVVDAATRALVGVINISEIVRGSFQSGYLGYYAFAPHAGKGLMSAGMALLLRQAFTDLALHRLEANIQPGNHRSIALVRRLEFAKEGYSPRYLKINGRWRDHERWALLRDQWRRG
jgi:[ribosomal protein S5]-alanine N-acetyltransferase